MKKIVSFFLAALFLLACTPKMSAPEYSNKIVDEELKIRKLYDLSKDFTQSGDLDQTEILRALAVKQASASIRILEKLPAFDGNTEFRNTALELFRFYRQNSIDNKAFILLLKEDSITEAQLQNMNKQGEEATIKGKILFLKYAHAQMKFEQKNRRFF